MIHSFELSKFLNKSIVSKNFIQKKFLLSTFIQKDLQKVIKSLPNWIQIPTPIHFRSLGCHQGIFVLRMALEIRSILVSISLSFSLVYSICFNHPNATQEVACILPYVMLFCNQVLLLTCQGHTFK
jgi:hypothetical protein